MIRKSGASLGRIILVQTKPCTAKMKRRFLKPGISIPVIIILALGFSLFSPVAAENRTGDAVSWTQRGDDLQMQGRYGDAVDAYNKALEIDPYYSIAWNERGTALTALGYYEEAIRSYNKAIELDPYYGQAWDNKGYALYRDGMFNESLTAYNRAIAINPNDLHALVNKGIDLQKLGRIDEARAAYEEVVKIADKEVRKDPNNANYDADLWANKGDALLRLGRFSEALDAYNRSLAINPKNNEVEKSRDLLIGGENNPEMNSSGAVAEGVILPTTPPTSAPVPGIIPLSSIFFLILFYGLIRNKKS
jgi:tetratricopeptide (TPR) repeat protein